MEDSLKQFCKNNETCRRKVLSQYFESQFSSPDFYCCDICDQIQQSDILIGRESVKIPSLTQRQQMFEFLNNYSLTDETGLCQFHLNEHTINLITDTFEYVDSVEKIAKYLRQPDEIAKSIFAIRKFVLSM